MRDPDTNTVYAHNPLDTDGDKAMPKAHERELLFNRAVRKMLYENGFTAVANHAKHPKRVLRLEDHLRDIDVDWESGIEGYPFIVLLHMCKDADVLEEVIMTMTRIELAE